MSYQAFTKVADNATLAYTPSVANMIVADRNGTELLETECDERR